MAINKVSKGRIGTAGVATPGVTRRTIKCVLPTTAASNTPSTLTTVPARSRITDVVVVMNGIPTAATPFFDIGTTGSVAFLLSALNVSTVGIKQGSMAAGARTFGTGLLEGSAASGFDRKPLVCDSAFPILLNAQSDFTNLSGYVVVHFEKMD